MADPAAKKAEPASDDRLFGSIAVEKGYISSQQLREALAAQLELKKLGMTERLGVILRNKRFMEDEAINDVLGEQFLTVKKLGDFEIIEKLGRGGMGMVFKARQLSMDRTVAIKILAPRYANDKVFVERFVREARAAGQFNHQNIVTSVDVGSIGPYRYLVMDFVDGLNLRRVLGQKGKLSDRLSLNIILQIAKALEHALAKGVIHRDVKPDNIMLTASHEAKLLDMGLVCAVGVEEGGANDQLQSGIEQSRAAGTPHYISPEAARGEENLDTRSDLYSLGCTLYQLLTGSTPYEGTSGRVVMAKHLTEPFPDVRLKCPGVSPDVVRILTHMVAKDKNSRYNTPAEVIEDVTAVLGGQELRYAPPLASPRRTGGNRRPAPGVSQGSGKRRLTGGRRVVRMKTTGSVTRPKTGPVKIPSSPRRAPRDRDEVLPVPAQTNMPWIIFGMIMALLAAVAAAIYWPKKEGPRRPQAEDPLEVSGAKEPDLPSGAGKSTPPKINRSKVSNPVPQPPVGKLEKTASKEALPLEAAQKALDAARETEKKDPTDFVVVWTAYQQAEEAAQNTELAKSVTSLLAALKSRWLKAFKEAVKKPEADCFALIVKGDFALADKTLSENIVPARLRIADWKKLLDQSREYLKDEAEKRASFLSGKAKERASTGNVKDLEDAIKLAQQAEAIPVSLAPSSAVAAADRAIWEKQMGTIRQNAEQEKAARSKLALDVFMRGWKEIAPLLKNNQYQKAMDQLDEKSLDKSYVAAKDLLRDGKADIQEILKLKEEAVREINKKIGEKTEIRKGTVTLKGTVVHSSNPTQVVLNLDEGPQMTVRATELDISDVERFAPKLEGDQQAVSLKRWGLLFLASGDLEKARDYFLKSQAAGLGDELKSYLERVDYLKGGQ